MFDHDFELERRYHPENFMLDDDIPDYLTSQELPKISKNAKLSLKSYKNALKVLKTGKKVIFVNLFGLSKTKVPTIKNIQA